MMSCCCRFELLLQLYAATATCCCRYMLPLNAVGMEKRVVGIHLFFSKTHVVFLWLIVLLPASKRQVYPNLRVLQHSGFQARANRDDQTSVQLYCGMRRGFPKVAPRGSGGNETGYEEQLNGIQNSPKRPPWVSGS